MPDRFDALTLAVKLAKAVQLMLPPRKWDRQDHAAWLAITGSPIATVEMLWTMAAELERIASNELDTEIGKALKPKPSDHNGEAPP